MTNYEEILFGGVLCYRTGPDKEWQQFTPEQLSHKVVGLQKLCADLQEAYGALKGRTDAEARMEMYVSSNQ